MEGLEKTNYKRDLKSSLIDQTTTTISEIIDYSTKKNGRYPKNQENSL